MVPTKLELARLGTSAATMRLRLEARLPATRFGT